MVNIMQPPAPSRTVDARHDSLEAALDVFKGPDSTAIPIGGRQQLRDLAEKHKQAAAKAVMLVSSAPASTTAAGAPATSQPPASTTSPPPPSTTPAELQGVTSSLEQTATALISYCHGFTAGSGPSLKRSLRQLCEGVVGPTRELVEKLAGGDGDADGLKRIFGLVWGACDELTRAPLDNKSCLFRQLADVMQGVKGAAKELDELCEASRQELEGSGAVGDSNDNCRSCNGSGGVTKKGEEGEEEEEGEEDNGDVRHDDDDDEEEDSDDFRDMGTLSASELSTAEAAAGLLHAAGGVVRLISRPLLEGPPLSSGSPLEQWESLIWHAAKLRSSCEALVACLYPPHDDLEELRGESEAVSNTLELMLGELPSQYFGGGEEEEGEEEEEEGEEEEEEEGGQEEEEGGQEASRGPGAGQTSPRMDGFWALHTYNLQLLYH
ncbi:hypothetical protein VOLCADRAFT_100587 [Volvox carteri f. nagariensis]|uniref:Cyclin-D1-binding protein 1-like N-terminal domain-containing protein n=1 Tax=Volvox carteri f. nagariensis TaxID=3068 RepID=D8UKJ9_VOLCA|nr:uncharacterized protein VOLCADRAFT_100587 [Volvox carteri f. nagariensis]EFJ39744.1 hypothetical protein VOLCADRAFT_100587 [Volvox carteri f. nagariensis]|eukprot:XP_002959182.1 hypothetical protein VOLCADRAFT_100587 [Volvox carteri f. nagariensis]